MKDKSLVQISHQMDQRVLRMRFKLVKGRYYVF